MGNIFDHINNSDKSKSSTIDNKNNNKSDLNNNKNYLNNYKNSLKSVKNKECSYENLNKEFGKENVDFALNNYNKYKDFSQDELINALYQNIQNSKKNGTFNYNQIKNSINSVAPLLNKEQQILLNKLLKEIE